MEARRIGKPEGFVWIAIGAAVSAIAWQSEVGSFHEPGPGFVGFVAGLFLMAVGLIMAVPHVFSKVSALHEAGTPKSFRIPILSRLGYTVLLLVAYGLLLDKLGYIVTTFLVMWGLFYERKKSRWFSSGLASLLCVAITYIVFELSLHCQFPRGIWPWR